MRPDSICIPGRRRRWKVSVWFLIATMVATGVPAAAVPKSSPARWVLASDIPKSEWKQATVTTFDVLIDQTGQPIKCSTIISGGSSALDAIVCASIMKRARFKPAKDTSGLPVSSVNRSRVVWVPDGYGSNSWSDSPDFVANAPEISGKKTKIVNTIVIMNSDGTIGDCFVYKSSKLPSLDERACAITRHADVSTPITDINGMTIRGVRSFFIGFKSGVEGNIIMR